MKVAIITRTKDRPLFLKRALQSVQAQMFEDYVHVIVNDGGNKQTIEKLINQQPQAMQEKIKLFHRRESSNAPDTIFNESIERVDSEFFVIHDDDDSWHPEFLTHTVAHLEDNSDLGAVVVRTDKVVESVTGDTVQQKKLSQWMPDVRVINLYRQCIDNQMTPIATLFRRSAYQEVGKFREDLPVVADWEFGIRLLQKFDIDFVDPGFALANYHHRKTGQVSSDEKHRYYTNIVMNQYLRQELADGRLGVGYIMSQLKHDQANMARIARRIAPGFLVNRAKRRIQD